ncbi:MAG: GNAT family N-acetyltransferase [Alkalispirochaeta sp.]
MEIRRHREITSIDPTQWNALADATPTPLLSWEWLAHLESSGSVTPATGWTPSHLTITDAGELLAAVPLYIRDTSWGEFVFDFAFAEVADRLGTGYYPKLVGMSPASPTPAFAFLVRPDREEELIPILFEGIVDLCRREEIPVLQFNFVLPEWVDRFRDLGMGAWKHHGFEWRNEGFRTFDDYLARFRKNQRRNIKRERRSLEEEGIDLAVIDGVDAPEGVYARMAEYYLRTNAQFGPYAARFLSARFFTEMPRAVRRHVRFVAAYGQDDPPDDPTALSMLLLRGDRLLGRYWGTREDIRDLHFNACYYAPIEWAISRGIATFDPGMGSPHKVRRGFRSVPNWSVHRFFDPSLQAIFEANIDRINTMEEEQIALLDAAVPYKTGELPPDRS